MSRTPSQPDPAKEARILALRDQVRAGKYRVDALGTAEAMLERAEAPTLADALLCPECGGVKSPNSATCLDCRKAQDRADGGRLLRNLRGGVQ